MRLVTFLSSAVKPEVAAETQQTLKQESAAETTMEDDATLQVSEETFPACDTYIVQQNYSGTSQTDRQADRPHGCFLAGGS